MDVLVNSVIHCLLTQHPVPKTRVSDTSLWSERKQHRAAAPRGLSGLLCRRGAAGWREGAVWTWAEGGDCRCSGSGPPSVFPPGCSFVQVQGTTASPGSEDSLGHSPGLHHVSPCSVTSSRAEHSWPMMFCCWIISHTLQMAQKVPLRALRFSNTEEGGEQTPGYPQAPAEAQAMSAAVGVGGRDGCSALANARKVVDRKPGQ